jgi:hypothetical protein
MSSQDAKMGSDFLAMYCVNCGPVVPEVDGLKNVTKLDDPVGLYRADYGKRSGPMSRDARPESNMTKYILGDQVVDEIYRCPKCTVVIPIDSE